LALFSLLSSLFTLLLFFTLLLLLVLHLYANSGSRCQFPSDSLMGSTVV